MPYRLIYTKRAVKDIRRLDDPVKRRVKIALGKYSENPLQFAQKLTNPDFGTYRFRIGDYRVIFDIEDDLLVILRVGHRKDIYRGV
jgi:mRNA interferase RelE/StbE